MTYTNEDLERMKRSLGLDKVVKKKCIKRVKDSNYKDSQTGKISDVYIFQSGKGYCAGNYDKFLHDYDLEKLLERTHEYYSAGARYIPKVCPDLPDYIKNAEPLDELDNIFIQSKLRLLTYSTKYKIAYLEKGKIIVELK